MRSLKQCARACVNLVVVAATLFSNANGQCTPDWSRAFAGAGFPAAIQASIYFDDGTGPALYVAGSFTSIGSVTANRIARWDGQQWTTLGAGLNDAVYALALFDEDGAGPGPAALFAAGAFLNAGGVSVNRIARWNGTSWSAVGGGVSGSEASPWINSLVVHDDGSGVALYAGGRFAQAGSVVTSRVARWNGSAWSTVGGGLSDYAVNSLASWDDDGNGPHVPNLYAATPVGVRRWNGATWDTAGVINNEVFGLCGYDFGSVRGLLALGTFTQADGIPAHHVARWDGAAWSPMGSGIPGDAGRCAAVFDDGNGPRIFAGGDKISRWDGASWSLSADTLGLVKTFCPMQDLTLCSRPTSLFAGGDFVALSGLEVWRAARLTNGRWERFGNGTTNSVSAFAVMDDDGDGPHPPALYVGGTFTQAGPVAAAGVARWDGASWENLGTGLVTSPLALEVNAMLADDSQVPSRLLVGGRFQSAGGVPVDGLASWNGSSWSALPGVPWTTGGQVSALVKGTVGASSGLFVGGSFVTSGGTGISNLAFFDGSAWSGLGEAPNGAVRCMLLWDDDGPGPNGTSLVVGGDFISIGGLQGVNLARWDGAVWHEIFNGPSRRQKHALAFDSQASRIVLFGGAAQSGDMADTWLWDGVRWVPSAASGPSARAGHAMAYDQARGKVVLFGGLGTSYSGETWTWDGSAWTLAATTGPSPRSGHAMAYDAVRQNVVLFGGSDGTLLGDTWLWDGTAWSPGPTGPSPRTDHAMAFHALTGQVVLFGGLAATTLDDTWTWSGSTWTLMTPTSRPPARMGHSLGASPSDSQRLLLEGGQTQAGQYAYDTWGWNGTRWSFSGSSPFPYYAYSPLCFDSARIQLVGVTGLGQSGLLTGTRVKSATSTTTRGTPPASARALLAVDLGNGPRLWASGLISQGVDGLEYWDGSTWFDAAPPWSSSAVRSLCVADVDGTGRNLYVGGDFRPIGSVPFNAIARFDGTSWQALGSGLKVNSGTVGVVKALAAFDEDGAGSGHAALYAGGDFGIAGTIPTECIARWGCPPPSGLALAQAPTGSSVHVGQPAQLTVSVHAVGAISYQWRRDGIPISDGLQPSGSVVSGSAGTVLHVANTQPAEAGLYDVVCTAGCSSQSFGSARLVVICPADIDDGLMSGNSDGGVDINDLLYFLTVYEMGSIRADLDNGSGLGIPDGGVDINDLLFFLAHYEAGC